MVAWLVAARFGLIWLTVGCIVSMLASLAVPCYEFGRTPPGRAERWLVALPLSVLFGWVSLAAFANTAAALKSAGLFDGGPVEEGWTVASFVTAGLAGSAATVWSRGNLGYGLTLIWGLVAIGVADWSRPAQTAVGPAAAGMAIVVALAVVAGRARR